MPYSSSVFDRKIERLLRKLAPKRLLDVGAGAGKYGKLAKRAVPRAHLTAVEVEIDYVRRFRLRSVYDVVWTMSAVDLIRPEHFERQFDVVTIGDTLEHFRKSDGIDLLNYLVYRCKWLVVQFPVAYLQDAVDGYASEAHISIWGETDFAGFDCTSTIASGQQRLLVLKGFLRHPLSVAAVDAALHK